VDITGFFSGIFGQIGNFLQSMLNVILLLLPDSPFTMLTQNTQIKQYLGWLNWAIPLDFALATLQVWVLAVAGFYAWQLLLRFLNAIE